MRTVGASVTGGEGGVASGSFPDSKDDPRRVAFSLTRGKEPPYRYGQGGGPR